MTEQFSAWPAERRRLVELIENAACVTYPVKPRPWIVEVGCYQGATSELLSVFSPKLLCVDPWDGRTEGSEADYQAFLAATKGRDNIAVARMSSEEAARSYAHLKGQIGLVFIDGDHRYPEPLRDISMWWQLLASGGVMVCHDFFDDTWGPGVQRAVGEFVAVLPRPVTVETFSYLPTNDEIKATGHGPSGLAWWRKTA